MALCLLAFAFSFVPSRATWPRLTRPAFWYSLKDLDEQGLKGLLGIFFETRQSCRDPDGGRQRLS